MRILGRMGGCLKGVGVMLLCERSEGDGEGGGQRNRETEVLDAVEEETTQTRTRAAVESAAFFIVITSLFPLSRLARAAALEKSKPSGRDVVANYPASPSVHRFAHTPHACVSSTLSPISPCYLSLSLSPSSAPRKKSRPPKKRQRKHTNICLKKKKRRSRYPPRSLRPSPPWRAWRWRW